MRKYNYSFELETQLMMFCSALDDIQVKRYDNHRDEIDTLRCRFVYAPKQRVLADLLDKAQNIQLPVIAITNGGIARDPNRVWNKIQGSYISGTYPNTAKKIAQPVPISITINCSILTRYQRDFDQIVSNIFSFFNPYIIISWRVPFMPDHEIRSQVIWNGSINTTYPYDINATQVARVQGETSFTFQGWLFQSSLTKDEALIYTVNSNFSTQAELMSKYSLDQLDPLTTERHVLSAQPQPSIIN